MSKEDYVSRETYKLLKEKGYDSEFKTCYDTEGYTCPAIHLYDAMNWLREVHGISIDIITDFEWIRDPMAPSTDIEYPEISEFTGYYFEVHQLVPHKLLYDAPVISKTYNIVYEAAIKYCLENLILYGKDRILLETRNRNSNRALGQKSCHKPIVSC